MAGMQPFSDGEDLSDSEQLTVSVDFLRFKALEVIKNLREIIPVDLQDDEGMTLLHWAALRGQLAKVIYLIDSELVSIHTLNAQRQNALELASKSGHVRVMDYLTSKGLSCEIKEAAFRLNPAVDLLKEGQLSTAIYADNIEVLETVWMKYVRNPQGRFSLPEHYEWGLLELAANFLSPRSMLFLLKHGCSLMQESPDTGYTPLHTLFSTFYRYLPPENDEEWNMVNSGCDCINLILETGVVLTAHWKLLGMIKEKAGLVGLAEVAASPFEREVELKVDKLRQTLAITTHI